jgi:hypothetical protein
MYREAAPGGIDPALLRLRKWRTLVHNARKRAVEALF